MSDDGGSVKGAREFGQGVCGHGLLCTREACRDYPQSVKVKRWYDDPTQHQFEPNPDGDEHTERTCWWCGHRWQAHPA